MPPLSSTPTTNPNYDFRLHTKLSFWLTCAGVIARLLRRHQLGGLLMLAVWFGWLGVLWQRHAAADLRGVRQLPLRPDEFPAEQFVWHATAGALGYRWITHAAGKD